MALNEQEVRQSFEDMHHDFEAYKAKAEAHARQLEARMNRMSLGLGGVGSTDGGGLDTTATQAFVRFIRGEIDERELKAMTIAVAADGGVAVPPSFDAAITKVGAEFGAVRSLARNIKADRADFSLVVNTTLAGASWVTESSIRANTSTPGLVQITPPSAGLAAVAPISNWLANDAAYPIESFVTESIGSQFGVTESAAFINGSGSGQPAGILSATRAATPDATRAFGTIQSLNAGSTSAITLDNLLDLLNTLAPRYRGGATWLMNPSTATVLRKLKDSTGQPLWQPSVSAGQPQTLLGMPVSLDVNVPVIASASVPILLGNFRQGYVVLDVGETLLIRDQVTSKGNLLIYCERRVGGQVIDSNAIECLVMSA